MQDHSSAASPTNRGLTPYEIRYGRNEPSPKRTALRAGALTAYLEGAGLRDVRFHGVEIVRRLYFALRDENWDTIAGEVKNLSIEVRDDTFHIAFESHHHNRDLDFQWHATIEGDRNSNIRYAMKGEALREFRYCRIGFCVLHATGECAGRPFRGVTPSGPISGELPTTIGPQRYEGGLYYPLFDAVSSLSVSQSSGVEAKFDFEGDLFEMEDQRNWTDGSFKTYCTPLSLGYPHVAKAGQDFAQCVNISASGAPAIPIAAADVVHLSLGNSMSRSLPRIGLGVATHDGEFSEADNRLLGPLKLDHLRVDLHLSDSSATSQLARAERECSALGCGLELALFLTDNTERELSALETLLPLATPVSRVLVFHETEPTTPRQLVDRVRGKLGSKLPQVPIGGGTNLYFAELNRWRPAAGGLDAVAYSINPQVHASDERSLVENLEAQRDTVVTARAFSGEIPVVVSPVTLTPRFNPEAVGPEPAPAAGQLPNAVDRRQMSLFGAAWTVASIKQIAEGGADSVTYYETTGWRGIKETDGGCSEPELFRSTPGQVFPVYHVFADLAELKAGQLIACPSADPLRIQGLAVRTRAGVQLLVANLTAEAQSCAIDGLKGDLAEVRSLDETTAPNVSECSSKELANGTLSLTLSPYGVTRVDLPAAPKEGW